jgi:tripartite-type tricarboxylate transporter receptor subunit TctC
MNWVTLNPRDYMMLHYSLLLSAGVAVAASAAATVDPPNAHWPGRPIRLIVPFPPGSSTDAAARLIAPKLGDALGQQVVIDNRAGASGNIGVELGARAAPDGYTLTLGTASTHAVAASVNTNLGYDPEKDFAPLSLITFSPYVLVAHPAVAATSLQELIGLAKTRPGELSYASAGNASLAHLAGEWFSAKTGIRLNHIPYKSSALAVVDLLSGRINLQFGSIAPTLPHIRSGRLRALATTGAQRVSVLPEVPTVIEAGVRGYEVSLWFGLLAPAATPASIVAKLNREINAILAPADVRQALIAQGLDPAGSTPAAFARRIHDEIARWREVLKTTGVRAD